MKKFRIFKRKKPMVEISNCVMFCSEGSVIECHDTNVTWHSSASAIAITPEQKKRVDRLFDSIWKELKEGKK